jgi:hypothetical protein
MKSQADRSNRFKAQSVHASADVMRFVHLFFPLLAPPLGYAAYFLVKLWRHSGPLWETFWQKPVDKLAMWLALSGIAYACIHEWQLTKQVGQLRELEKGLSTHRLPFPGYLAAVRRLAQSQDYLDIFVDFLDYGSFFAPDEHREAHNEICHAAGVGGVRVRMLVCGKVPEPEAAEDCKRLTDFANLQYYDDREVEALVANYVRFLRSPKESKFRNSIPRLTNDEAFKLFAEAWFTAKTAPPEIKDITACIRVCNVEQEIQMEDVALFRTLLQIRELWFAEELKVAGVEIRALEEPQSLVFWHKYKENETRYRYREGDESVFTFTMAARGKGQLGFITRDTDLVSGFGRTFCQKWDEANRQNSNGAHSSSLPWHDALNKGYLLHG